MSSFLSYTYLVDKYANPVSAESIYLDEETSVKFRIDKGMSTRDIAEQLYDLGLIQNKTIYRFLSKFNGFDGQYKVGTYTLCEGLSYDEIMTLLAGEPETVRVTFPEGFTTEQIAARLEANNVVTADEFLAALETIDVSSYPFLGELAGTSRDHRLDGYLFPDTYEFYQGMQASSAINKFLENFHNRITAEMLEKADERGMSMQEVVTVASMIEKEAANDDERAMIAAVIYNRIAAGMPLQIDSTIMYVLPEHKDVLTVEDTKIDSPYNTYQNTGLPPTPIANPGLASIKATLSPASTKALYYALDSESGTHKFFTSYGEFQAFVAKQSYSQ